MSATLTVVCDKCCEPSTAGRVLLRLQAGVPQLGPIGPELTPRPLGGATLARK
jgi:hypothetical protein